MKKTVLCLLLLLAGCAKQPGDIVAAAVPTDSYMQADCASLATQKSTKQAELDALSSRQTETANRDAAWMTIIHVPVASMARGDDAEKIAALKGEINAIDQTAQSKSCAAQTPGQPAATKQ
jgi:uncharacterized protein YfaP (DUF2135 family)